MGFLNDWIAGCNPPPPHLTFPIAIMYFLMHIISGIFSAIFGFMIAVLDQTVLSQGGTQTVMSDLRPVMTTMAGLGMALLITLTIWSVLASGEQLMIQGRWDGWQGLVGRMGVAFLWIGGSYLAVNLLMTVNTTLVHDFSTSMALNNKAFAFSCNIQSNAITELFTAAGAGLIFAALGIQGIELVLIIGLFWVIAQWLGRLVEILFWASLMPIAAATIMADPSRRIFQYVWKNVQGAILTQAAMGLGLWLIFKELIGNQANIGVKLLTTLLAVAGVFMVAKIPQYFRELNGHSSSGGFDMAKGAGAILMAQGAGAALAATPIGQMGERFAQYMARTSDQTLNRSHGLMGRAWHRMGQQIALGNADNNFQQARYEATPGVVALNDNAERMRDQAFQDYLANQDEGWGPEAMERPLSRIQTGTPFRADGWSRSRTADPSTSFPTGSSPGSTVSGSNLSASADGWASSHNADPFYLTPLTQSIQPGGWPSTSPGSDFSTSSMIGTHAGGIEPLTATPLTPALDIPSTGVENSHATPSAPSHTPTRPPLGSTIAVTSSQKSLSADEFVANNAPKMQNYLRHVVQPQMMAANAFNPQALMAKTKELQGWYKTLGQGGPEATKLFAKLSGVTVEQLGQQDVQDRLGQDLVVKQYGGTLRETYAESLEPNQPLSNYRVDSIDSHSVAWNFTQAPGRVAGYLMSPQYRKTANQEAVKRLQTQANRFAHHATDRML